MATLITNFAATTVSLVETTAVAIPTIQFVSLIIYTIVGFVCVINNGVVIYVIVRSPKLNKRLENSLLFNQCLIDIVTGICLVCRLTTTLNIPFVGLLGEIICRCWASGTILWWFLQTSVTNLVIITVERYYKIVHPLFHKVHQSRRLVWCMILFPWIFGLAFTVPYATLNPGVVNGQCRALNAWANATAQSAFGVINLLFKYLLPLAIFFYCYLKMMMSLKKDKIVVAPYMSNNKPVSCIW